MSKVISIVGNELVEVRVPVLKTVEIDFGLSAVRDKTFMITDADVTPDSLVMANTVRKPRQVKAKTKTRWIL